MGVQQRIQSMRSDLVVCGEFELYRDGRGHHRFRLTEGDRILLDSRAYKSRYGCTVGIAAVRARALDSANFAIERTPSGRERLKLLASNFRILGIGPRRPDVRGDLVLVQRIAPDAPLNDRIAKALQDRQRRSRHRIYAAPRNAQGAYRPPDASALIVQGFESEAERNHYWERRIRPVTVNSAGALYEYVMCDYPDDGRWRFVSERRYSNARLICGNL